MNTSLKAKFQLAKNKFVRKYYEYKIKHLVPKSENSELYKTILTNSLKSRLDNTTFPEKGLISDIGFYLKISKLVIDKILVLKHIVSIQPLMFPVGIVYSLCIKNRSENENDLPKFTRKGANIPLSLEVIKSPVSAKTLKVQTAWNVESSLEKLALFKDYEDVLAESISTGVANDLIRYVINDLNRLALDHEQQEDVNLNTEITKAATKIAIKTRRGAGNFIIINPEDIEKFDIKDCLVIDNNSLSYIGTIHNNIRVLISEYVSKDTIIVGYHSTTSQIDSGYIFSPYVPVVYGGMVIDPSTYNLQMNILTRFGYYFRKEETFSNSENYYQQLSLKDWSY